MVKKEEMEVRSRNLEKKMRDEEKVKEEAD